MDSVTSSFAARLAHRLAGGGIRRSSYRGVFRGHQGPSREREIAFRAGPQISIELYSSDHRRRPAHGCAVSSWRADRTPRHLVAAVRYGDCHRRGLFWAPPFRYWAGPPWVGSERAPLALSFGRRGHGRRVWRIADLFWFVDRPQSRGIAAAIKEAKHG